MTGENELIVLGVSGNSLDLAEIALMPGSGHRLIGLLDDDEDLHGTEVLGVPVIGGLADADRHPDARLINGIGSPRSFRSKPEFIEKTGAPIERFVSLVHPTASVSPSAEVGVGTGILQMVTVSVRARIGNHVILLPSSIVSHDVEIGDHTCVAGAVCLSGGVRVGRGCYIGAHASIRDGVSIGDGAMIGMGAVVITDVPAGETWVGVPARPIES